MARRKANQYYGFVLGMLFSFSLSTLMCRYVDVSRLGCLPYSYTYHRMMRSSPFIDVRPRYLKNETQVLGFVFIAVMTSEKYLNTRAKGVWETWGQNFSGKLVFFTGRTNRSTWQDMPVIQLEVEDNVYPPQRKALLMLKYVYDHFMAGYKWYIRADDDVYMRTHHLYMYLRRFDSSEDLVIGHPGIGKKDELGLLGLGSNDNFCMGGPGIIMTSSILKKMGPHLLHCINSTASFHEDVEVGRCIRRFAGAICPWGYEMKEIFRQVYEQPEKAYHDSLNTIAIDKAVNLHPVKDPAYMRRVHVHFLDAQIMQLNKKKIILAEKLRKIQKAIKKERKSEVQAWFTNSSLPWETFNFFKVWALTDKPPLRYIHYGTEEGLQQVTGFAKEELTRQGESLSLHSVDFGKWYSGYMRLHPTMSAEYIFEIPMKHQTLVDGKTQTKALQGRLKIRQQFDKIMLGGIRTTLEDKIIIHFIIPLMGRLENFKRFLAQFEKEFLITNDAVKILVVYFPDAESQTGQKKELEMYSRKYPSVAMNWLDVKGAFKRAVALQKGTDYFAPDSLLYYCDVDVVLTRQFADRCRATAKLGKRAYFPVMFSQFNPKVTYAVRKPPSTHFHYSKEAGFWRWYSFGPACVYAQDVIDSGGLDTSLTGWGLEDVDLYEKFIKREDIEIIRAPDLGIVHVYHPHAVCDPQSNEEQQAMCHAAEADLFSNAASAVDYMHSKGYLDYLAS